MLLISRFDLGIKPLISLSMSSCIYGSTGVIWIILLSESTLAGISEFPSKLTISTSASSELMWNYSATTLGKYIKCKKKDWLLQIHGVVDLAVGIEINDFCVFDYFLGEGFEEVVLGEFLLEFGELDSGFVKVKIFINQNREPHQGIWIPTLPIRKDLHKSFQVKTLGPWNRFWNVKTGA